MKLYDGGVYLVNGKEIMTDAAEVQQKTGKAVTRSKEHYGIWYSGVTQYFRKYAEITDQV